MSIVDPTKTKPITQPPPTSTPPPKEKNEKKSINLEAAIAGPKPDYSKFVALNGPGVAGKVFGPVYPDPRKLTDEQLAGAIQKMGAAMTKHVGLVNNQDFKLYDALIREAATREVKLLKSTAPIDKMSNADLVHNAIAFDLAKASGMKLTPEQEKRHAALNAAISERAKVSFDGEIGQLQKVREQMKAKMMLYCPAAATGAYGLATHQTTPAMLASGALIYHSIHEGHYGAAMVEGALLLAGRVPGANKAAEGIATAINTAQCANAAGEYKKAGDEIDKLEAMKASKALKKELEQ
jgi:hypothetical protein